MEFQLNEALDALGFQLNEALNEALNIMGFQLNEALDV